jgi:hypothetical protein
MLQDPIDLMNFLLDLVLVAIGFWLAWNAVAARLSGPLGGAMRRVSAGALILGLAHLTETVLDQHFHLPVEVNELTHRVVILVGFVMIGLGLGRISGAIRRNAAARQAAGAAARP